MTTKYDALEMMQRMVKSRYSQRELNKPYWVAEWGWSPICDGIYPCEETFRFVQVFTIFVTYPNAYGAWTYECPIYQTTKNNRYYFPWEVFDSKEDAVIACAAMNSYGYDYDASRGKIMQWILEVSGQEFEDHSLNGLRLN